MWDRNLQDQRLESDEQDTAPRISAPENGHQNVFRFVTSEICRDRQVAKTRELDMKLKEPTQVFKKTV